MGQCFIFIFTLIYSVPHSHLKQFSLKIRSCNEELLTVDSQTSDLPEGIRATRTDNCEGRNFQKWRPEITVKLYSQSACMCSVFDSLQYCFYVSLICKCIIYLHQEASSEEYQFNKSKQVTQM